MSSFDGLPATAPLTPDGCNLRGLPYMPLDVVRFLESDLVGEVTPSEGWAAILLWAKSWLQVPAASLPANDRQLARWVGMSDAEWHDVRPGALRGWRLASNGRLYHPVVAEKALSAWVERLRYQQTSAALNARQGKAHVEIAFFDAAISEGLRLLADLNPGEATRLSRAPRKRRSGSDGDSGTETRAETVPVTDGESPPETLQKTEVEAEVEVEVEGEGEGFTSPIQRSVESQGSALRVREPAKPRALQPNRAGFSGQAWAVGRAD